MHGQNGGVNSFFSKFSRRKTIQRYSYLHFVVLMLWINYTSSTIYHWFVCECVPIKIVIAINTCSLRVREGERVNMISDSLIIHTKWQWIIIGLCICVCLCVAVREWDRAAEVFVIHSWYMDEYNFRIVLEIKLSTSFFLIRHEIAFSPFCPTQSTSIIKHHSHNYTIYW